jgi:hypothetical protein
MSGPHTLDRTALAALSPSKIDTLTLDAITEGALAHIERLTAEGPKKLNRAGAIRRKCIDCNGGYLSEVRQCEAIRCPLWLFRLGDDPYRGQARRSSTTH